MPFQRPTLSQLRGQVAADINAAIPGADGLLRFSNVAILGKSLAGLAHLHYGYLDFIALQAVPYTATEEFLEGWAALKGITRNAASTATGSVTFTGTSGTLIPASTLLSRGDGYQYKTNADATIGGGGTISAAITAVLPPVDPITNPGGGGASGNADSGTVLTLGTAIPGVSSSATSSALTGGADVETDASLRNRMLLAYQAPPQGGDAEDYVEWALAVPGVTRAWVTPHGLGAGTVIVRMMFDVAEAVHNGFPQGTDGVAAAETRDSAATGDQLAVANHIFALQPVTALVYAVAPTANTVNFTINGISGASSDTKAAIAAAIDDVFVREGAPGGAIDPQTGLAFGPVDLSSIESAIAAIAGTAGFVITSPSSNITSGTGAIPIRGTVTYT